MPENQTSKISDEFEKELDEYFKERSQFRVRHFSDDAKADLADERSSGIISPFSINEKSCASAPANTQSNLNYSASNMSGCCMSGCFDCPWGFGAKQP